MTLFQVVLHSEIPIGHVHETVMVSHEKSQVIEKVKFLVEDNPSQSVEVTIWENGVEGPWFWGEDFLRQE